MRRRSLAGLVLAGTLALGMPGPALATPFVRDATPDATPTGPTAYTLTADERYGGDGIVPLALSPDGTAVATWDRTGDGAVCSAPTLTRQAPTCASFEDSVAPDSVRWSPDGTRFAFTEDVITTLWESDIHVFDVESGDVTDLTDDGAEGGVLDLEGDADIDLAPAWSPDGEQLVFARSPYRDGQFGEGSTLYRVRADGTGDAEPIALVSTILLAVYGGIHWTGTDRILYSVSASTDDADNGIWSISPEGGEPERIVDSFTERGTGLILVDVSADGGTGLILDQVAASEVTRPTVTPTHYLLDLDGGDLTPLDFGAGELAPSEALATDSGVPRAILAAGFAPDGRSLAVVVALVNEFQLWIVDSDTGDHTVAGTVDQTIGGPGTQSGLIWGENDLLLGPAAERTARMLTLEPAD